MYSCRPLPCLSSSSPSTGLCRQEVRLEHRRICKSHLMLGLVNTTPLSFSSPQRRTEAESRNHPHATKWPTNVFQGHAGVKGILSMASDLRKDSLCKEKGISHLAQVKGKNKLCFQWESPLPLHGVISELLCRRAAAKPGSLCTLRGSKSFRHTPVTATLLRKM